MPIIQLDAKPSKQKRKQSLYNAAFAGEDYWKLSACTSPTLIPAPEVKSHFWHSVAMAHGQHYPLVLKPESVWLTLLQGLTRHIEQLPDLYRTRLGIQFQGKRDIIVRKDDVDIENVSVENWVDILNRFSLEIDKVIGSSKHALFFKGFSQSDTIEEAAIKMSGMSLYKSYFNYTLRTMCGIPYIEILGDKSDWVDLYHRVSYFSEFDLAWWTKPLQEILEQFIAVYDGYVNKNFWKRIYNNTDTSGVGETTNGWIAAFFPYINIDNHGFEDRRAPSFVRNTYMEFWKKDSAWGGCPTKAFPQSVAIAPFVWDYLGTKHNMEMVSGVVGISQKEDNLAIRPEIGFAVKEIAPR